MNLKNYLFIVFVSYSLTSIAQTSVLECVEIGQSRTKLTMRLIEYYNSKTLPWTYRHSVALIQKAPNYKKRFEYINRSIHRHESMPWFDIYTYDNNSQVKPFKYIAFVDSTNPTRNLNGKLILKNKEILMTCSF